MSQITIDLREAYDSGVTSLPEIETVLDKLLQVTGRTVGVTILRESLELVHSANAFNLLNAIQKNDEEGGFLRAAFVQMAAPEREIPSLNWHQLHKFSNVTQDLFVWIINYRRQKSFDKRKLDNLLTQVDAAQSTAM